MEAIVNPESPLPPSTLQFDNNLRIELKDAARWGRLLSIMGFILCGFIVVVGIVINVVMKSIANQYVFSNSPIGFLRAFLPVIYIVTAVIYLFPFVYLYRFATRTLAGLETNDQSEVISAIKHLKDCFRFIGILFIMGLAIYAVAILLVVVGIVLF